MNQDWKLNVDQGVGILELDAAGTEVNVLTSESLVALQAILKDIASRGDLKALLIVSAKPRIFIAGADIKEIDGISTVQDAIDKAEQGKMVLKQIEDLKIPVVCAINGACLGGGYELALACHWRVAALSDKVKIGLPEVNLGILPGFGGSIRLPRLVGLVKGLSLILAGKVVSPQEAIKLGMVDKLFAEGSFRQDALKFTRALADKPRARPLRKKDLMIRFLEDTPLGRSVVLDKARKDVMTKTKGVYPAPLEVLELLRKTYGSSSPQAYRLESEHFGKLGTTEISKNLIKVFFLSEKYKKVRWTETRLDKFSVRKCGVVGAGIMGGGIAQLVSSRNIPVRVKDLNEKALGGALKEARKIYDGALKRRRIKKHELELKMGLISVGLTPHGLKNCDFLIEAVVEDMKIKQAVFKDLSERTGPDVVLASNTSSLSVTEMASVCRNPERVVGLHFFNPVHRMPLVEIIRAAKTSDATVEKTVQFSRLLGKTVIVVKDAPGFLVNRLLLPYMNEAAYLLEEGMSPETIDRIATAFGMPMGPIELVDQVGIDVGYKVAHVLFEAFGARMKVPSILDKAKQKGLLGKKSGKGFYVYDGKKRSVNPELLISGTGRISDEDALKRMMYIMINEASRCLEEKVVDSAGSVDIGMIMGTGFPPFRGGLLRYADTVGLASIVKDLERFSQSVSPERFAPGAFLANLARQGKTFHAAS